MTGTPMRGRVRHRPGVRVELPPGRMREGPATHRRPRTRHGAVRPGSTTAAA